LGYNGTKLMLQRQTKFAAVTVAFAVWTAMSHAGERITLSNGFAMDCNHHATVDGRMRLYLNSGENSYIEVQPDDVTAVESIPDPPAHTTRATAVAREDAKLSPADLHEMLAAAGQAHNIDADLLASVVKAESNGNAQAVSRAGARGLMQLMPATASDLGVTDSFRPDQNVRGGSTYLDALLIRYHENLALALAAYNAGPAAVDKYHGIPPYRETRLYVARIIHEFNRRVRAREAHQAPKPPANSQAMLP
jgi:Transglycosylase SLT domain